MMPRVSHRIPQEVKLGKNLDWEECKGKNRDLLLCKNVKKKFQASMMPAILQNKSEGVLLLAQVGMEHIIQLRLATNSQAFCLSLHNAGVPGVYHLLGQNIFDLYHSKNFSLIHPYCFCLFFSQRILWHKGEMGLIEFLHSFHLLLYLGQERRKKKKKQQGAIELAQQLRSYKQLLLLQRI